MKKLTQKRIKTKIDLKTFKFWLFLLFYSTRNIVSAVDETFLSILSLNPRRKRKIWFCPPRSVFTHAWDHQTSMGLSIQLANNLHPATPTFRTNISRKWITTARNCFLSFFSVRLEIALDGRACKSEIEAFQCRVGFQAGIRWPWRYRGTSLQLECFHRIPLRRQIRWLWASAGHCWRVLGPQLPPT